jgi:uncharacterized OB-fold protein
VTDAARAGDPISAPFWDGAERGELLVQRCPRCGAHQFYARPFCLACGADDPEWVVACGGGTVYSAVCVRIPVRDELAVPYAVGLVELDEGPRLLAGLGAGCHIGARVVARWLERADQPPVPRFVLEEETGDAAA